MLEGRTYVPLIYARLAEMRALRELPTSTKNLIFPIVRIRPWLNAKRLDKVFDVIEDSFGNRAFGLDLDQFKFSPLSEKPAHQEFARLFDPDDGFSAYYSCVTDAPNRVPVLRRNGNEISELGNQLDRVATMDRGAVVRLSIESPGDYALVAEECVSRSLDNITFVVDCGWRQDVLVQAASCVEIVNTINEISEEFEVVVAGSSFPNAFANMGEKASFPINERTLFQNVRQNVNQGRLFYGDWGSTRPPTDPVPMTNVPRIDIAGRNNWTAWRSEGGESYEDIAARVVDDDDWDESDLWGDYMIASTAEGSDPAIKAPAMAAAVRVNLHMNAQARFNEPGGTVIEDEPVGEDL